MRGDKDIAINVETDDNSTIMADKTHLANVLNNLIDNAIKYSGNSVEINITGNDNEISVSDNGIGIPSKSIPYLFNKFYRVPHGNRQDADKIEEDEYLDNIMDTINKKTNFNSQSSRPKKKIC